MPRGPKKFRSTVVRPYLLEEKLTPDLNEIDNTDISQDESNPDSATLKQNENTSLQLPAANQLLTSKKEVVLINISITSTLMNYTPYFTLTTMVQKVLWYTSQLRKSQI